MDLEHAVNVFAAFSQEIRLKVFKLLIEYGCSGTAAGTISDRLGILHNTLSFHLSHLTQVGLITSRKQGSLIIYATNTTSIEELIGYLLRENCCILEERCDTDCNSTSEAKNDTTAYSRLDDETSVLGIAVAPSWPRRLSTKLVQAVMKLSAPEAIPQGMCIPNPSKRCNATVFTKVNHGMNLQICSLM
ncbi:hypothetical protein S1OALGB6SA_1644 [Olavius algarvensis spirochete endosymbiont]|nr:hypothetical protein S1OALGB6SA_1644 [Olavius algarvensis spirochete endosymbiont]